MSFASWVDELESLEIPPGPDSLTDALVCWDRYTARVVSAVRAFDDAREWEAEGAVSLIGWLRTRRLAGADAARFALLAKRFRCLPVLAEAALSGELSNAQVRVVAQQVIDRHVELFAEHEAVLVPSLVGLSVLETQQAMAAWRAAADALDDGPEPRDDLGELHLSTTLENRGQLNGSFDTESTAILTAALRLADSNDVSAPVPQRRAEALVDVCRYFLDNQTGKAGGRHRPHINIVVQADSLGTDTLHGVVAETGYPLGSPTLERLLCDCNTHRAERSEDGAILDYGRATKSIPAPLFNALVVRDRHCRFPGCDRPPSWCEAHHVWHWINGGRTSIWNLVLLCAKHHKIVHRKGWRAELRPDGEFVVTSDIGLTRSTRPPAPPGQLLPGATTKPPRKRRTRADHEKELARQRARALVAA